MGPLHDAARCGLEDEFSLLLQECRGFEIDSLSDDKSADVGLTALHIATKFGYIRLVELLLERNADMEKESSGAMAGFTALCFAAYYGHLDIVNRLLARDARVNVQCTLNGVEGYTPLLLAGVSQQLPIVKTLLESGANPQAVLNDQTSLVHIAVLSANSKLLEIAINAGAPMVTYQPGYYRSLNLCAKSALHIAAQVGKEAAMHMLINHGASLDQQDMDYATPLQIAACHGHISIVQICLAALSTSPWPPYAMSNALAEAISNQHHAILDMLLNSGADPNGEVSFSLRVRGDDDLRGNTLDGQRPLLFAAKLGDISAIHRLLAAGANVNIGDSHCRTPLYVAIFCGREEAVRTLIQAGTAPSLCVIPLNNIGFDYELFNATPLHAAAAHGTVQMGKDLLEAGVDMERSCRASRARLAIGWTALHCAAAYNRIDMMRFLLENGADVNKNGLEGTALMLACNAASLEACAFLLAHGADVNASCNLGHQIGLGSALHAAVASEIESLKKVKLLLSNGAVFTDHSGALRSHVHAAIEKKDPELLRFLLAAGADYASKDHYSDETPFESLYNNIMFCREERSDTFFPFQARRGKELDAFLEWERQTYRCIVVCVDSGLRQWQWVPIQCSGLERTMSSLFKQAPEELPQLFERLEEPIKEAIQVTLRVLHRKLPYHARNALHMRILGNLFD